MTTKTHNENEQICVDDVTSITVSNNNPVRTRSMTATREPENIEENYDWNGDAAPATVTKSSLAQPHIGPGETTAVEGSTQQQRRPGTRGLRSRKNADFAMKSIRRGSTDWNQILRPFVANIAFESCEQSRRYVPSNELSSTSNYQKRFRPYTCHAAVLFVDLCNYSKITSTIAHRGAHVLSSIVNEYLHRILQIVHKYGGDVIKFAGDAIIVIWYSTSEANLPMNVLIAAKCVLEMQEDAGEHPVRDTSLHFRIHCGLSCGMLESEIYTARNHINMQRLFHSVGGNSLVELSDLVDVAKPGEVCVSNGVADHLHQFCTFIERTDEFDTSFKILSTVTYGEDIMKAMMDHIEKSTFDQKCKRIKSLEEEFIHPNVIKLLSHSGLSPTQISQMRNLCILFIAMTSSFGSTVNWLMEVQTILDKHRCPSKFICCDIFMMHLLASQTPHMHRFFILS
jgi:class 3 adenylate cyclase